MNTTLRIPCSCTREMIRIGLTTIGLVGALLPVIAQGQVVPVNDFFTNATVVSGATVTVAGSNVGASKEPGEPAPGTLTVGGKSVWWSWTALDSGTVTVDTIGSSFDTVMGVYRGDSLESLTTLGSDDDGGGKGASKVEFWAEQDTTYRILVDGYNPRIRGVNGESGPATNYLNAYAGDIVMHIHPGILVSISSHPQSRSLAIGGSADLSVTTRGAEGYQWFKNGLEIAEATNSTLTITNARLSDSGVYNVLASNAVSAVTSSNAVLAVGIPLISQQPKSQTAAIGYDATFIVKAAALQPIFYQWRKGDKELPGATSSTLVVTNVQQGDADAYSVLLSGESDTVLSSNALLTVIPAYTFGTLAGQPGVQGRVDGLGGAARFSHPSGIAIDRGGNLYVTEWSTNQTIRKITPEGKVTTVAGVPGNSGTNDGSSSTARFYFPEGIAVDQSTNLFVADNFNHTIRKISPDDSGTNWLVSTLAGVPGVPGWNDGDAHTALFRQPSGVALDAAGNVYVAEWRNNALRKITPDGVVTTLAGFKAGLSRANSVSVDSSGNLFAVCEDLLSVVKISPGGLVSSFGSLLRGSYGGTFDNLGNMFVGGSFWNYSRLRMITPSGDAATIGGVLESGFAEGTGKQARFYSGQSRVAVDAVGNVYVADNMNHVIRKGVPFAVSAWSQDQAIPVGTGANLSVAAFGIDDFTCQWFYNETAVASETNNVFEIGSVVRTNSGIYSVLVSNGRGNSVKLNTTVRALVSPVIEVPQVTEAATVRLLFRDADGGLPYDLSKVAVQCRTNLAAETSPDWISLSSPLFLTNGFVAIEDTNTVTQPVGFYRVLEW